MKRTIYADKDGIINQLQEQRLAALSNAESAATRYLRMFWTGRVQGIESAIRLLEDWAGEHQPDD